MINCLPNYEERVLAELMLGQLYALKMNACKSDDLIWGLAIPKNIDLIRKMLKFDSKLIAVVELFDEFDAVCGSNPDGFKNMIDRNIDIVLDVIRESPISDSGYISIVC